MIPKELIDLVEQQRGDIHRTNKPVVEQALEDLGVPLSSELAEFFLNYRITSYISTSSDEELCDIAEPTPQIQMGTEFIHDVWELPLNFICLTSAEGTGAYLYDKDSGSVFEYDLDDLDVLISGELQPSWNGFFEFMKWYLKLNKEVRPS